MPPKNTSVKYGIQRKVFYKDENEYSDFVKCLPLYDTWEKVVELSKELTVRSIEAGFINGRYEVYVPVCILVLKEE